MPNQYEIRTYAYYCPKCGQCHFITYESDECLVCKCHMIETPHEYNLTEEKMQNNYEEFEKNEKRLFDEVINKSPEFDQDLYDHRDERLERNRQQQEFAIEHGKAVREGRDKGNSYGVSCPYCHATNVRKIGVVSRSVSAGIFGLGSSKIGKQWHCDHCGSDF